MSLKLLSPISFCRVSRCDLHIAYDTWLFNIYGMDKVCEQCYNINQVYRQMLTYIKRFLVIRENKKKCKGLFYFLHRHFDFSLLIFGFFATFFLKVYETFFE